jgi:hypothetical protein
VKASIHADGIGALGISDYCVGVLAGPIARDTGWSRGFLFVNFTVALLVMGVVFNAVRRAIDQRGGCAATALPIVRILQIASRYRGLTPTSSTEGLALLRAASGSACTTQTLRCAWRHCSPGRMTISYGRYSERSARRRSES